LFFLLDQKEPKNQGKADPSGRFALPTPLQSVTAIANSQTFLQTVL
jgi:hypothetical protein